MMLRERQYDVERESVMLRDSMMLRERQYDVERERERDSMMLRERV